MADPTNAQLALQIAELGRYLVKMDRKLDDISSALDTDGEEPIGNVVARNRRALRFIGERVGVSV